MTKQARNGPYICGIDAALDVVSGKWKGLILWELDEHGQPTPRIAESRRSVYFITPIPKPRKRKG